MTEPTAPRLFIDADACPVKEEAYKVAKRYGLQVYVVANSWLMVPSHPRIERVVVEANDSRRADWWTALAFRGSKVLATNLDGSEVYLKHAGLFRPNPENGVDGGPRVTGVPFGEVDFRDLDSEHVRPEGIDLPGPGL